MPPLRNPGRALSCVGYADLAKSCSLSEPFTLAWRAVHVEADRWLWTPVPAEANLAKAVQCPLRQGARVLPAAEKTRFSRRSMVPGVARPDLEEDESVPKVWRNLHWCLLWHSNLQKISFKLGVNYIEGSRISLSDMRGEEFQRWAGDVAG